MAQTWQSQFNFQNVIVWGDTTDYIYQTWMANAPFSGGYPGTMVIDIDTMAISLLSSGGPDTGSGAVQAILDNPHPCAEI